jgi:hypothetical protein
VNEGECCDVAKNEDRGGGRGKKRKQRKRNLPGLGEACRGRGVSLREEAGVEVEVVASLVVLAARSLEEMRMRTEDEKVPALPQMSRTLRIFSCEKEEYQ